MKLAVRFGTALCPVMGLLLWITINTAKCYGAPTGSSPAERFDYAEPKLLTGTLYAAGSDRKKIIFTFRRSALRSGSTIRVERHFDRPDGSTGAVENIVYESGQLEGVRFCHDVF